jgi:hypothetical protein
MCFGSTHNPTGEENMRRKFSLTLRCKAGAGGEIESSRVILNRNDHFCQNKLSIPGPKNILPTRFIYFKRVILVTLRHARYVHWSEVQRGC